MRRVIVLALVLSFVSSLAAAKTCTGGCPCGDTCIDCSDTCHAGSGGDLSDGAIAAIILVPVALGVGIGILVWLSSRGPQPYTPPSSEDSPTDNVQIGITPDGAFVGVQWEF